jgi:hypothetical protein
MDSAINELFCKALVDSISAAASSLFRVPRTVVSVHHIERTSEVRFYTWVTVADKIHATACGETKVEALKNLLDKFYTQLDDQRAT